MGEKQRTVYWDTEDNSPELFKTGRSGLEKVCTQIAAMDCEGERFYLRPTVIASNKKNGITRHRWNVEPFFNWLASRGPKCVAYAHNTQYDLGNLVADELDRINVTMVGGRLVTATWDNVKFNDTANIFPMPLKKLGETVGIKKLEMDVNNPDYVWQDVRIVEAGVKLLRSICDEYQVEPAATLGGLCVRIWQAMGGYNWPCSLQSAREAFFGGRTELWAPAMEGNLWYTDVNSLYPSVMRQKFPTGDDLWFGLDNLDRAKELLVSDKECYGLIEAEILIPDMRVAPLPVRRDDDSVYFPIGRVCGWWTVAEVRAAFAKGAKLVKMFNAFGSRTGEAYYSDFVEHFYAKRRVEKDEGRKLMLKLLMNNLYGQLGMSGKVTRSLRLANHAALVDGEWMQTKDGIPYGEKLLAETQMPLGEHVNWMHAAHVTSYGRLRLQHFLDQIPPDDLVYCDTDSIFFRAENPPFPVSDVLGEMKLETRLTHALCKAPKMYRITEMGKDKPVTKVKGVPRRDGLAEKMFDTGSVAFEQPYKLREAIQFFDANRASHDSKTRILSAWRTVTKRVISEYDKKSLQGGHYFPIVHG